MPQWMKFKKRFCPAIVKHGLERDLLRGRGEGPAEYQIGLSQNELF